MVLQSYRELIVWQKAMQLVQEIYTLTETFPRTEIFGLTARMRRSAISIPSNIAEGNRRSTRKDYRNFLVNAFGSGAELEISRQLKFGAEKQRLQAEMLLEEVMRMLNRMTIHLKQPSTS